jgi:hypothetical protein
MALTDPQSVVIGANTRTVAKVSDGLTQSIYSDIDNGVDFTVSHQNGKRKRTSIRVDQDKIAADPLTAVNQRVSASAYLVIDRPITGFTKTELKELALSVSTWLTAGSSANLLKVLGDEH